MKYIKDLKDGDRVFDIYLCKPIVLYGKCNIKVLQFS